VGAIEVKLGENEVEKAAINLKKISDINIKSKPSFLMIVTSTQMAYQRQDGVHVVPVGCLKP
jgi:uncharacterized protein